MQNAELRRFFQKSLAQIEYDLRDLQQAYSLCGETAPMLERRMQGAREALIDARGLVG
jgi:hypothetical protein